jgi:hypothetical protein
MFPHPSLRSALQQMTSQHGREPGGETVGWVAGRLRLPFLSDDRRGCQGVELIELLLLLPRAPPFDALAGAGRFRGNRYALVRGRGARAVNELSRASRHQRRYRSTFGGERRLESGNGAALDHERVRRDQPDQRRRGRGWPDDQHDLLVAVQVLCDLPGP